MTQGWYLGLSSNEKVLSGSHVFNSVVYFSTFTPATVAVCDNAEGIARLFAVQMESGDAGIDFSTGLNLPVSTAGGLGPSSTIVGEGIPSEPDVVMGESTDTVVVATTEDEMSEVDLPSSASKRLRYWREVY